VPAEGYFLSSRKPTEHPVCRKYSTHLFALIGVFGLAPVGSADDVKPTDAETRIVLRISREFIRRHNLPPIDEVEPIDRCLLGAHVVGQLHTTGVTTMNMDIEAGDAIFTFRLQGTAVSHSVAVRSPVEVFSTGVTNFEAERAIRFDGLRFAATPANLRATYAANIDGLATPGGILGRIIRKRAWATIQRNEPIANAIAFDETKQRILEKFDRRTDQLVNELNRVVPLENTIALLAPQTKDWIVHVRRTKDYVLVSPGPKDAVIPILPKESAQLQAPLELWLRGKPGQAPAVQLLQTWSMVNQMLSRFRVPVAAKEKLKLLADLKFSTVGDWQVIKVGEDLLDRVIEKIGPKPKTDK
jgi:hypothetical protein